LHCFAEDPEERKRSLDLKLQTIDPVDDFRRRYIDVALSNSKGVLSQLDITTILSKAQEYLDQGLFATEQYLGVMKQIQLVHIDIKIQYVYLLLL